MAAVSERLHTGTRARPGEGRGLWSWITTVDHKRIGILYLLSACVFLLFGGIEAFLKREVLPHAPDAWYVPDSVKTGYEISFTRYFYKPQPLRTLEEIRADILALEKETEGLLGEIIGGKV